MTPAAQTIFCFEIKNMEQKFDIEIICFKFVTELLNTSTHKK